MQYGVFTFESYIGSKVGHNGAQMFVPCRVTTSIIIVQPMNNPLTPNDPYMDRTAPLTSRCFILYIYSTNIHNEYFKHAPHSAFFPLQNAIYSIMLHFLVPVLFIF
jgi:hypothetical protein